MNAQAVAQAVPLAGTDLRALRERRDLSRAELSRRSLVDASTIARAERGERVSPLTLRRILAGFEEAA